MKPRHTLRSNEHRLARLVAWTAAVLAWLILGAPAFTTAQRRRRARLAHVSAERFAHLVRDLIIIRAAQLMSAPLHRRRPDFTPAGFARRRTTHAPRRAIAGVWLRRRLKVRGGFTDKLVHLLGVLRDYRALGAQLAARRRKRLTRRTPIIMTRPAAHCVRSLAHPAILAADSS